MGSGHCLPSFAGQVRGTLYPQAGLASRKGPGEAASLDRLSLNPEME